jgi:hypothetical protein
MSLRAMTLVWEYSRFKGTRLLLMLAIADHCNDDLIAWPGRKHLARKIRMSERFTIKLIDELIASKPQELALLSPGGGRGHSPRYQIVIREHANGLRTPGEMDVHKGGGGVHPLSNSEAGFTLSDGIKGEPRLRERVNPASKKTVKGEPRLRERVMQGSPEPSLTITNTLTQTATDRDAAAVEDVSWNILTLAQSSKLPKAKRTQLEGCNPSGGAFVSKYLYALAHPGFRKPALWASAQVIENPGAWEGQPYEALAGLGPAGLAHVLAWMRDDAAYPLSVNGSSGAALAFRAHMQHRHAKEPGHLYLAVDDAIIDLGLSGLAIEPAAIDSERDLLPTSAVEPEAAPNAWQLITAMLGKEVSRATYGRLMGCRLISADGQGLVIAAPSKQDYDWLQNRMGRLLAERFSVSLRLGGE